MIILYVKLFHCTVKSTEPPPLMLMGVNVRLPCSFFEPHMYGFGRTSWQIWVRSTKVIMDKIFDLNRLVAGNGPEQTQHIPTSRAHKKNVVSTMMLLRDIIRVEQCSRRTFTERPLTQNGRIRQSRCNCALIPLRRYDTIYYNTYSDKKKFL